MSTKSPTKCWVGMSSVRTVLLWCDQRQSSPRRTLTSPFSSVWMMAKDSAAKDLVVEFGGQGLGVLVLLASPGLPSDVLVVLMSELMRRCGVGVLGITALGPTRARPQASQHLEAVREVVGEPLHVGVAGHGRELEDDEGLRRALLVRVVYTARTCCGRSRSHCCRSSAPSSTMSWISSSTSRRMRPMS